jgi:LemA protein
MAKLGIRPWWIWVGLLVLIALYVGGTYNRLVSLDQAVQASWAQVENVYQRRADLVPNLVNTVKGAASFEKSTLEEVTQARTRVAAAQGAVAGATPTSASLSQYQMAQDGLSQALTRFFAVAEAYPALTATANFRDLQSQLEGTENRIAVERRHFNEAARQFNAARQSFPTNVIAGFFGPRFAEKAYFQATPGSQVPPKVDFLSPQKAS